MMRMVMGMKKKGRLREDVHSIKYYLSGPIEEEEGKG